MSEVESGMGVSEVQDVREWGGGWDASERGGGIWWWRVREVEGYGGGE